MSDASKIGKNPTTEKCPPLEKYASKDRERIRTNANGATSRPTLGAVGRVASKVRTTGIQRISSAFLPRIPRVDEPNDTFSPWGQGGSPFKEEEEDGKEINAQRTGLIKRRPSNMRRKSDVLELTSPMSATSNASSAKDVRDKNQSVEGNDRNITRKNTIGIGRGDKDMVRGLVRSVSRFGVRGESRSKHSNGSLRKSTSSFAIGHNRNAERAIQFAPMLSRAISRRRIGGERENKDKEKPALPSVDPADSEISQDLKFGVSRDDNIFNSVESSTHTTESKIREKHKKNLHRTTSRTSNEKTRKNNTISTNMGMSSSMDNHLIDEILSEDEPSSSTSSNGKKVNSGKGLKTGDRAGKGVRVSWLGSIVREESTEERHKKSNMNARLLERGFRNSSAFLDRILGNAEDSEDLKKSDTIRSSGKPNKQDDDDCEGFNSEEDEFVTEVAPRSVLLDDYIAYQTNNNNKKTAQRYGRGRGKVSRELP